MPYSKKMSEFGDEGEVSGTLEMGSVSKSMSKPGSRVCTRVHVCNNRLTGAVSFHGFLTIHAHRIISCISLSAGHVMLLLPLGKLFSYCAEEGIDHTK